MYRWCCFYAPLAAILLAGCSFQLQVDTRAEAHAAHTAQTTASVRSGAVIVNENQSVQINGSGAGSVNINLGDAGDRDRPANDDATTGSGQLATRDYPLTDFDGVVLSSAFRAEILQSDHYQVRITADDNVLPHIQVQKDGTTLRVALEPDQTFQNTHLRAQISLPALHDLTVSGACRVHLHGFRSEDPFRLDASGASRVEGDLTAGSTILQASGASQISLTGSARQEKLEGSGASRFDLQPFQVGSADVTLSGASRANVNATGALGYSLEGASHLEYSGHPVIAHSVTTGASSVTGD